MITLKSGNYTKYELEYLQNTLFQALPGGDYCCGGCKKCKLKHLCYDIDLVIAHIEDILQGANGDVYKKFTN